LIYESFHIQNQRLKGHILIVCAGLCDSTVGVVQGGGKTECRKRFTVWLFCRRL